MIISRNTDSMAYAENQFYKAYNKYNSNDRKAYCRTYLSGIKEIYHEFCSSISGMAIINNEDKKHYFLNSFYRVFDLLYSNYSLDYISNGFVESVKPNIQKLIDSIADKGFYETFGDLSGFMVYDKWYFTYCITNNLSYFTVSERNNSQDREDTILTIWDKKFPKGSNIRGGREERDEAMKLGLAILIFKHFGEVETVLVGAGAKRVIPEMEEKQVLNRAPFKVNMIDCSWLKTIIRKEGFLVRGHFRLQRFGIGRLERRLIYIKPFKKNGYVRRARKLINQEKRINESCAA